MKDLVIKGKCIRRELLVLACCLAAGIIFDLVAIIIYDKPFVELFQTAGYVLFVAILLYLATGLLRFVVFIVRISIERINK